ncbi:MAG: hypothetical protein JJU28_21300 [Cyclobacteriaceae bacterium]|nr:hypothetical protein [Cyclobacteriaceae bacterium]
MLKYAQQILSKVSFDEQLFEKELRKSIKWLPPEQNHQLRDWCYQEYGNSYNMIIDRCFTSVYASN